MRAFGRGLGAVLLSALAFTGLPGLSAPAAAQAEPAATGGLIAVGTPAVTGPALGAVRGVGVAATPSGRGAWVAGADGGVFTFGDADFHGSAGGVALTQPIVDIDATRDGDGYWLLGADGGVFTYGDAAFHGSTGAMTLNAPVVALVPTPTGRGYWLVARDGGIFTFGDAGFHGSTGGIVLNQPIVDAAATPSGDGYWLVASDGAVFSFGDADFHGSAATVPLTSPITAVAATRSGDGYWLLGADGGIFAYGGAAFPGTPTVAEGLSAVDLAAGSGGHGVMVLTAATPRRASVGPPLPPGSGTDLGRRVVYAISGHRVWLVGADGAVEHSYPVSGRADRPATGVHRVWSRSLLASAGHDGITMRLMVRFAHSPNGGNIGFHAIPRYANGQPMQTEAELGLYRSSGCVRQSEADAVTMWNWAPLGTTVVVVA